MQHLKWNLKWNSVFIWSIRREGALPKQSVVSVNLYMNMECLIRPSVTVCVNALEVAFAYHVQWGLPRT